MQLAVLALVVACASARPDKLDSDEFIPILRDDRVSEDDGTYAFEMESANGIKIAQSGSPDGPEDAVVSQGGFEFEVDGEKFETTWVANENGFQPQGAHLPVAPAFPHPIPQFVLDQIAKAAEEHARGEVPDYL